MIRRVLAGVATASALVLGLAGCGGSGDDNKATTTSSSLPPSTATSLTPTAGGTAATATTKAGTGTTRATTATSSAPAPGTQATAKPAPSVTVTLYARAGEIPPGQTTPLEAPAWKATGVGWDAGHVDMIVKRTDGPSVVLDVGADANADGRFEQTFVVLEVQPGTYAAIATQGTKQAQGTFVL